MCFSLAFVYVNAEICLHRMKYIGDFSELTCAVGSIPCVPSFAETTVRAWLVHAPSARVAVVSSNLTLIDVSAFPSSTFISITTNAAECTDGVRTGCIDTAIVCLHFAFINVSARSSITFKSTTASAII